ncbi:MAG: CCA tRNA nucleotidyltransferase [Planctomycetota bacterium]
MLRDHGHIAYFAGGCVRDALLGRSPKDFDVATDAVPDRVREVFGRRKTLAFGASFGVIGVLPPKKADLATPTEVATFRSDGDYSDGRRPDEVHFGDAENDAQRRDFTVNGLFYDPGDKRIIDYVDGEADLKRGVLRTIGDPARRFDEDKLRMLRAVRFATTLDFSIDADTAASIREHAEEIRVVSAERIGTEMRRVIKSQHAADGLRLLVDLGLEPAVLPGIANGDLDALTRWLAKRDGGEFESSMALVLMAMDDTNQSTADVSQRWRLSNEETRRIRAATSLWHSIADAEDTAWSTLQPKLIDRDIEFAMRVASAVVIAEGRSAKGLDRCRDALAWERQKLDPPPLLTGDVLREHGFQPGPSFRDWLHSVRRRQLDGELESTEQAIEWVREISAGQ